MKNDERKWRKKRWNGVPTPRHLEKKLSTFTLSGTVCVCIFDKTPDIVCILFGFVRLQMLQVERLNIYGKTPAIYIKSNATYCSHYSNTVWTHPMGTRIELRWTHGEVLLRRCEKEKYVNEWIISVADLRTKDSDRTEFIVQSTIIP